MLDRDTLYNANERIPCQINHMAEETVEAGFAYFLFNGRVHLAGQEGDYTESRRTVDSFSRKVDSPE